MCKNNGFSVLTGLGLELAAEPLRTPVWEPKWVPVLVPKSVDFRPEGGEGTKKRGSKNGPRKKVENGAADHLILNCEAVASLGWAADGRWHRLS